MFFRLIAAALLFAHNAPAASPPSRELFFQRACEPGQSITIAAVGDILLHKQLQVQAYSNRLGHESLWQEVVPYLSRADLAYGNLEGPVAPGVRRNGAFAKDPGPVFDDSIYSGFPLFNYHPSLIPALQAAGIDVVSTANNHAMDRGPLGVDLTIDSLQRYELPFAGTRTREEVARGISTTWHVITEQSGFRIAWIACSFSTNGNADPKHQVLLCFRDADLIERAVTELSQDPGIDAVILTPHWGEVEYTQRIEPSQAALARRFLNAGATAILGNHPHVTKPWEKIVTKDGRETFVIYSIGNFISAQVGVPKQTSAVIYLGLSKRDGEKAWVNGVRYLPLYMKRRPFTVVPAAAFPGTPKDSYRLLESLLGTSRQMKPGEAILTNPECRY